MAQGIVDPIAIIYELATVPSHGEHILLIERDKEEQLIEYTIEAIQWRVSKEAGTCKVVDVLVRLYVEN